MSKYLMLSRNLRDCLGPSFAPGGARILVRHLLVTFSKCFWVKISYFSLLRVKTFFLLLHIAQNTRQYKNLLSRKLSLAKVLIWFFFKPESSGESLSNMAEAEKKERNPAKGIDDRYKLSRKITIIISKGKHSNKLPFPTESWVSGPRSLLLISGL